MLTDSVVFESTTPKTRLSGHHRIVLQQLCRPIDLFFTCALLTGYAASDHHPNDALAIADKVLSNRPKQTAPTGRTRKITVSAR